MLFVGVFSAISEIIWLFRGGKRLESFHPWNVDTLSEINRLAQSSLGDFGSESRLQISVNKTKLV